MREHCALVFKEPAAAKPDALRQGDFQSVGMDETLARLKGIASVELSTSSQDHLKRLAKERNKLQHFGFQSNKLAIDSISGKTLDTLLSFVVDHLVPDAPKSKIQILAKVQDLIEETLRGIAFKEHSSVTI
jgi:hypothetical protein